MYIDNKYYKTIVPHYENLTKEEAVESALASAAMLNNYIDLAEEFVNSVRTFAIVHAKAVFIKEYSKTHDKNISKQKALKAADDIFENAIKNVQNTINFRDNYTINLFRKLGHSKIYVNMGTVTVMANCETRFTPKYFDPSTIRVDNGVPTAIFYGKAYAAWSNPSDATWWSHRLPLTDVNITVGNKHYVVFTKYNIIDKLKFAEKQVHDNLDKYFENVVLNNNSLNSTVLDPYVLAQEFSTSYKKTGYYGYAAAMLAMSGMPTAGLSKTVSIKVGNKTLSGFMFTDFNTTLTKNKTYNLGDHLMWMVTQDGLYKLPKGTNFTVVDLRDWRGNELNSTNIQRYTDHLLDNYNITKSIEDLIKHEDEIIREIDNQTTVVGGGNKWANALNNFWDSLDWQVKAIIVFAAILAVLAIIGRSFGKGGVRVG